MVQDNADTNKPHCTNRGTCDIEWVPNSTFDQALYQVCWMTYRVKKHNHVKNWICTFVKSLSSVMEDGKNTNQIEVL